MLPDVHREQFDNLKREWDDRTFLLLWDSLRWQRNWLRTKWRIPGMTWDQVEGQLMLSLSKCIFTYDGRSKTTTYLSRVWVNTLSGLLRSMTRESDPLAGAWSLDQSWDHSDRKDMMRDEGPLSDFLVVVEPPDTACVEELMERVGRLRAVLSPMEVRVLDGILETSTGDERGTVRHLKRAAAHAGLSLKAADNALQRIRQAIRRHRI